MEYKEAENKESYKVNFYPTERTLIILFSSESEDEPKGSRKSSATSSSKITDDEESRDTFNAFDDDSNSRGTK